MDNAVRFESRFTMGPTPLRPHGLTRELAEQVEILADGPSHAVTYSDLYDHLRSGLRNVLRLLPTRTAHAPR
jgi:hypothetical protein